MVEELRDLYAYNRWANQRTLAACAALFPEALGRDLRSSFPSVLATLGHILSAEWIWLERWNGRSPARVPDTWDLSGLAALSRHWADVEREQIRFLQAMTRADPPRVVDYRNTRGVEFAAPLWQLMRHVVNHSTYHRGQVVTMLRQLGAEAPATDLVLYYREMEVARTDLEPPAPDS